jgi:Zn-dependent peptidase ImmA (M78 family)
MSKIIVNINPQILKWAREESGFDISEITEKASIITDIYLKWEEDGKNIPYGKLKTVAEQFKRQIAFFFLPQLPPKSKKPKDFRNLAQNKSKLSNKVLYAIRETNYFLDTALSLKGNEYWENNYKWLEEISPIVDDENELIKWLREKLEISIEKQIEWNGISDAWREWRESIENKLGIFVYQFSMSVKEVQGFGIVDKFPYGITVNSKYSYQNRIFTLFHEIAHILRKHSSLCLIDRNKRNQNDEELTCNSFTGKFLIPQNYLEEFNNYKELKNRANKLKVSSEAYLRRVFEEDLISRTDFFSYLSQIRDENANFKSTGGYVPQLVKSHASRGKKFFDLVIDSLKNNVISYSQASSLLNLKINMIINEF